MSILIGIIPVLAIIAAIIGTPLFLVFALGFRDKYDDIVISWVFGVLDLIALFIVIGCADAVGRAIMTWWAR